MKRKRNAGAADPGLRRYAPSSGLRNRPVQRRTPLLQEIAHRRIGLEPDRALIGLVGGRALAGARQQSGARRPIGLVFGEPRVVRERVQGREIGRASCRERVLRLV